MTELESIRQLFSEWEEGARALGWSEGDAAAVRTDAVAQMAVDIFERFLDPDVEYREDPAWPGAGVFRGREAVLARFRDYWEMIAFQPPELRELIEGERGLVAAVCRLRGTGHGSGTPFEQELVWVFSAPEGLIRTFSAHFDRASGLRTAGVAPVE